MFGNPYFNQQTNIDRINNQIKELETLRGQYQNLPQQQPIQNIINTQTPNQIDFEARYLKENEIPEQILVQRKTAFIGQEKLVIKDINGDILEEYEIKKTYPIDKRDKEIEELKKEIERLKEVNNEYSSNAKSINEIRQSSSNDTKSSKTKSTNG